MSATVDSKHALHVTLGLLATISMCCSASAAEEAFKWKSVQPSNATAPPGATAVPDDSPVIEGAALRESDVKWSFIDWVNAVASGKQQKAASYIASVLGVDLATATQLIAFSAEATSRVDKITRDLRPEMCSALRSAANTEQSFVDALEALDLRGDNLRNEALNDFDSSFASDSAAKIHTFLETTIRPGQHQIKSDLHKVLADPAVRETVRSRACEPVGK